MYDDDYTLADARADAAQDAQQEEVDRYLQPKVEEVMDRVEQTDEDMPHPWTRDRHMLQTWLDEGEDALREGLEEEFREEAEDEARDNYEPGPCCNDFACPCGNSNSYRG
jgi:hypothetical protein